MRANEKAINWPNSAGATPLMMAVVNEWNEGVSELLLANADVAACDHNGSTVLHDAAMHADSQLLRELLSIEEAMQVGGRQWLQSHSRQFYFYGAMTMMRCGVVKALPHNMDLESSGPMAGTHPVVPTFGQSENVFHSRVLLFF